MFGPQVPAEQQTEVEPEPLLQGRWTHPIFAKEGSRRVGNLSNVQKLLMSVSSYRKVTTTAQFKTLSTIFRCPRCPKSGCLMHGNAQEVSFRMVTKDRFTELLLDVSKGSEDSTNGALSGRQKKDG